MARAVIAHPTRRQGEPLYDRHPQTGAVIEVFHADRVLAESFGACGAGWFWHVFRPGCLPDDLPIGPFMTSYRAYRDAVENLPRTLRPILGASDNFTDRGDPRNAVR
jgi:hypothetical protein